MVVDVEFLLPAPPGVALPVQAVIDSGLHKIVYVQHQGGQLEPRIVELGERSGDRVLIRKGLSENELVVVDGNFLTDSESRMRRGSLSAAATSVD
jgi:Cu(I)/Ag(I) efflux system membrane fusion protein